MNKLRASFSLLHRWESGNHEEAISMYFRLKEMTTRQMADGKELHVNWSQETNETKCLPKVFGGEPLKKPETEKIIVVNMAEWLDLKCIIDCLDAPTIHEYKSGIASSEAYANGRQLGVYAMGCIVNGIFVDKGIIHRWNRYNNQVATSTVWLTDKLIDECQEWVMTVSSEIYSYFQDNNLFDRFAGRRQDERN